MGKSFSISIIKELVITEFKLKYKSPAFGYLWCILNPLASLFVLHFVFFYIMQIGEANYQVFLLIGIITWNFFKDAVDISLNSVLEKGKLIKKLRISPATLIVSSVISSFLNFCLNFIVFILFMLIFKVNFSAYHFIHGFFYLLLLVLSTFGVAMVFTALYVELNDIKHIWGIISHIWFWMTPVFYSETRLSPELRKYYMANPVARGINHLRDIFINKYASSIEQTMITVLICLVLVFAGFLVYRIKRHKFAEEV